ncbi:MAG: DUF503 domain-containing protein [Anaerolineae bacterium]|nr:DUF503 domain-containing protein [Anaerolineae bacterium]
MIIGACVVHLYLPGVMSLKEKRALLKPLCNQLRKHFEVAVAEVENQDIWQSADLAIVTVANASDHVYAVLDKTLQWIEAEYRAVEIMDWETELR